MAKLAVPARVGNNRSSKHSVRSNPQPRGNPDPVDTECGDSGDILRNGCGQSSVDHDDNHPPVRHPDGDSRVHRDVTDAQLISEVALLRDWDHDTLLRAATEATKTSPGVDTVEEAAVNIVEGCTHGYTLTPPDGVVGGLVLFSDVSVGHMAMLHLLIWNPRYFRRRDLFRAILRDAFKRWDLRRIATLVPDGNPLASRFARTLGGAHEGRLRSVFCYNNGEELDADLWSILRGEI